MRHNRWFVLGLLYFARATMGLHFGTIAPIVPFLVADLEVNYTQVGILIGLFNMPGVVLALPGGMLTARFGDKKVLVTCLALMTLGALLLASAATLPMAFAGRLLSGVGGVVLSVTIAKVVTDRFMGAEISTAQAIQVSSYPLGISAALAGLGALAAATDWHVAAYTVAVPTALALVLVLALFHDLPPGHPDGADADDDPAPAALWRITRTELWLILAASSIWTLVSAGFLSFLSFLPTLLVSHGSSAAYAGFVTSLMTWVSIASGPVGGQIVDRTGRRNLLIPVGIFTSMVVFAAVPLGAPALVLVPLAGLITGLAPGGIMSLPGQVLSPASRSTGFGVFFTLFYLGIAVFPALAGALQDITGQAETPVLVASLYMGSGALAFFLFRALQRRWMPRRPRTADAVGE